MSYTATTWVQGTTPGNATNLNHVETQYAEAVQSFEQDLFTPFTLSGLVATKDGTTLSQLDVTAGVSFLLQSADGTLRRRATAASTPGQFTTALPTTTYYLDLNPDGTFSWGTAHSGVANHLTICTVVSDASSNISTVTDTRTINTTLFLGAAGTVSQNAGRLNADSGAITSDGTGKISAVAFNASGESVVTRTVGAGSNIGVQRWLATDGHSFEWLIDKTGDILLYDNTAVSTIFTLSKTAFSLPGVALSFGNLTSTGHSSLDNGTITTNGTGTITAVGFAGPLTGTATHADDLNGQLTSSDDGANTRVAPVNNSRNTILQASGAGGPVDVLQLTPTAALLVAGSTSGYYIKANIHGTVGDYVQLGTVRITGSGAATVSHTLGVSPATCMLNTHVASGTETLGYDSETSTTVHVDSGGTMAWVGQLWSIG